MAFDYSGQRQQGQDRWDNFINSARNNTKLTPERWQQIATQNPNESDQARAMMSEILTQTPGVNGVNPNYIKQLMTYAPAIKQQQKLAALGGMGSSGNPSGGAGIDNPDEGAGAGFGNFLQQWLGARPQGTVGSWGFYTPNQTQALWNNVSGKLHQSGQLGPGGSMDNGSPGAAFLQNMSPEEQEALWESALGMYSPGLSSRIQSNPQFQLWKDQASNYGGNWIDYYLGAKNQFGF